MVELDGYLGLPLIARFRHRIRGITCALKSIGVAHSQQASLRQDIAPVVLRSRVPFRSEPYSEPGGGSVSPISDWGLVLLGPLILVENGKLWASDGVLETAEPRALMFSEEELYALM
ncbi:hypothetical protein F2Q70_00003995 [Brassica cretica]|uniref:Uncharacterized protein n=1 Tax=Brassica cretica TaxID=69181 RepID=A0A8S9IPQ6_BRACR|nr:hypothetical protein F2Q70_00003995 [Brassica cretica]